MAEQLNEQNVPEQQVEDKHEVHVTVEGLKGTIVQPMEMAVIDKDYQPAMVKMPNGDVFPIYESRAARRELMHRVKQAIKHGKPVKHKKMPKGVKVKTLLAKPAQQSEEQNQEACQENL